MSEIIKQAKEQTATEVLLDALNSIATETCDHGPGLCPREVATQALADHDRILAASQLDGPERIRVIVRPGKDDWIGVAYSSSVERNDIIREYVKPQFDGERLEFASDVCRSQQYHVNELEQQRIKLLLYVDHLGGCASYTNGACTCELESVMQSISRQLTKTPHPQLGEG